jgi:hypothetical protein
MDVDAIGGTQDAPLPAAPPENRNPEPPREEPAPAPAQPDDSGKILDLYV